MIYRILLFKKFQFFLGIALFLSSAAFVWVRYSRTPEPWLWLLAYIFFIWILLGNPNLRRCTLFEAALPIHARDLFCARAIMTLMLLWVSVFISAVAFLISHSSANWRFATLLFEEGAVMTLMYIALHSMRAGELSAPRWWRWTIFASAWVLFILSIALIFALSYLQLLCVIGVCGLGSVVLFLKTWTSFPQSFQLAPKEAVKKPRKGSLSLPTMAWRPALSALYDFKIVVWILLALAWGAMGNVFFLCGWAFMAFAQIRTRLIFKHRWIFGLPISRRGLFAMSTLAPLAAIPLSALIQLRFSPQPATVIVLDAVAGACVSMMFIAAVHVPSFIPLAGPWQKLFLTLAACVPGGWLIWHQFNPMSHPRRFPTLPIELWFASIPHARLPLLMLAAGAILLALYGLAYLGFRRMEIPPRRMTPAF